MFVTQAGICVCAGDKTPKVAEHRLQFDIPYTPPDSVPFPQFDVALDAPMNRRLDCAGLTRCLTGYQERATLEPKEIVIYNTSNSRPSLLELLQYSFSSPGIVEPSSPFCIIFPASSS